MTDEELAALRLKAKEDKNGVVEELLTRYVYVCMA
jgi:hypothetical protein